MQGENLLTRLDVPEFDPFVTGARQGPVVRSKCQVPNTGGMPREWGQRLTPVEVKDPDEIVRASQGQISTSVRERDS